MTLNPATRSVQSVVDVTALPVSDIVGLGDMKSVYFVADNTTTVEPGHRVVEAFALLRDSSVLLFRSTFAPPSATVVAPTVRVLAKLAVSETVVAASCSIDKAVLFAVLADMWVTLGSMGAKVFVRL